MPDDKPIPLPLSGEEVQEAILFKVAESLGKTCHLKHDNAYTSFKAEILIKLTLNDYGRVVHDNHLVSASAESELKSPEEPRKVEANITMEPMPPNQVRVETNQGVPVPVTEGGKQVIKSLRYAPRQSKIGQE